MTMILSGTDGGTFPSWTTAGRPASPAVGQMGYNTTTGAFDAYTAAGWTTVTSNKTAGAVLQVVNSFYNTYVTSTSTSYTDTGLTASITPTSATSKILVLVTLNAINTSSVTYNYDFQLVNGSGTQVKSIIQTNTQPCTSTSLNYLDSPATTSSYTYKVQFKIGSGGTVYMNNYGSNNGNTASTITLLEIAA